MAVDEFAQMKSALVDLSRRTGAGRHHPPDAVRDLSTGADKARLWALKEAGLDLDVAREWIAASRGRPRDVLLASKARMRRDGQEIQADGGAFAAGIAAKRRALAMLAQPFTSTYVTLGEPFFISELPPNLDVFGDWLINPFNSWAKINLNKTASPGGPSDIDCIFYFLWENPSEYYAVVNVSSSLALYGQAGAQGAQGILSGNRAALDVNEYLSIIRWSGWGTDPDTGQSVDQSPYPILDQSATNSIVTFDAYGGDIFHDPEPGSILFDPRMPYDVAARLIAIPGRAVSIFAVDLNARWWFHDGAETVDDDSQLIYLDLAAEPPGYLVRCPMVDLEVLTSTNP